MARYIDADKLFCLLRLTYAFDDTRLNKMIDLVPIEDVKPVGHAHWIETYDWTGTYYITCSNPKCGLVWWLDEGNAEDNEMFYCPKCGYIMDEEVE